MIFDTIGKWIRQVFGMIGQGDIKGKLGVDVACSEGMADAQQLWLSMYRDNPPWKSKTVQTLGLPASIAREIARLTTIEMKGSVTGSARAAYLQEQLEPLLMSIRPQIEIAAACGGMALKPYADNGLIRVDCVRADAFFPTAYDGGGNVTGAVFVERYTHGGVYYTRLEQHEHRSKLYTITNKAYASRNRSTLEREIDLAEVDRWASLAPSVTIENVERPLFAYFRTPLANDIDPAGPLGVSVYAGAADLIREADRQYSRLLWEFEGSELAIDASADLFQRVEHKFKKNEGAAGSTVEYKLPKGRERLFRLVNFNSDQATGDSLAMKTFAPQIRDASYLNGLNAQLQRIEFACGLAYGTLSEPQSVDKTATEIKMSRQRSYALVADMQARLEAALNHLVYAMDVLATIYRLAPAGGYETAWEWDDSIIVDTDVEFNRRLLLVQAGILRPEALYAWYFGTTEEQARELLPQMTAILEQ